MGEDDVAAASETEERVKTICTIVVFVGFALFTLAGCRDASEMDKENTRHIFDKRNERLREAVPTDTCHEIAILIENEGKAVCPSGTWLSTWHQMDSTHLAVQCKCLVGPVQGTIQPKPM